MKIKGVYSNATKGKRRGDPIEYSAAEKVPHAVRDGLKAQHPDNEVYIVGSVIPRNASLQVFPKDSKPNHVFANNVYMADGTVKFKRHTLDPDKLFPTQSKQFKIQFEDTTDDLGQPDLKINSFQLS